MPIGLINAPAIFQFYINQALAGLMDIICVIYLDDILIYSKNKTTHVRDVREVLARLKAWGLYINLRKSNFHIDETAFLGFVVNPKGLTIKKRKSRSYRNIAGTYLAAEYPSLFGVYKLLPAIY
jgi:hypothetical protein